MDTDKTFTYRTRRHFLAGCGVGVALGVAGSTQAGPRQEQAGDQPGSPWKKALENGASVELLGVTTIPAGPDSWWSSTGERLSVAPSKEAFSESPIPETRSLGFAARVVGLKPADDAEIAWTFSGSIMPEAHGFDPSRVEPKGFVATGQAAFGGEAKACTVRVGVTWLPHIKLLKADANGSVTTGTPIGSIAFARARKTSRGTSLVESDNLADGFGNVRLVAVDRDGKRYAPESSGLVGDRFRMLDAEFAISPDAIEQFLFEARPYQWIEFRDVCLRPASIPKGAK